MNTKILHHLFFFSASFVTVIAVSMWGDFLTNKPAPKNVIVHSAAPEVHPPQTSTSTVRGKSDDFRASPSESTKHITPIARQALALQRRLRQSQGYAPPLFALTRAITERQELMTHHANVTFTDPETGNTVWSWDVSLQRYPSWITLTTGLASASYEINPKRIIEYFARNGYPDEITPPLHSVIVSTETNAKGITYAETTTTARPGLTFNVSETAHRMAQALTTGNTTLSIALQKDNGRIYYASASGVVVMDILGQGRSNFARSVPARDFNIRRALDRYLHNILIPPGETFSFNKIFGGAVTVSQGWKEALGIFNGQDLAPTPGGGICQTSTTFYRALINAGLPIEEQHNHSLYVHYYEKYGVGLDATIFMGQKDLVFRNDTPSYLLVQAYADGYDAYINLYGVRDGRTVELKGPYFATNAPADFTVHNNRKLHVNEIAWIQRIKWPNGESEEHVLVSRYKDIPVRLLAEHKKGVEETVEL